MVSITKCHQWHVAMENIYNYYQQPLNPCHTGFKQSCFLSSRTTDSTWRVWGKKSYGRIDTTENPSAVNLSRSLARVPALQER